MKSRLCPHRSISRKLMAICVGVLGLAAVKIIPCSCCRPFTTSSCCMMDFLKADWAKYLRTSGGVDSSVLESAIHTPRSPGSVVTNVVHSSSSWKSTRQRLLILKSRLMKLTGNRIIGNLMNSRLGNMEPNEARELVDNSISTDIWRHLTDLNGVLKLEGGSRRVSTLVGH